MAETFFLVLFPIPLGDFMFQNMELDLLLRGNRVLCLDLGDILHEEMGKKVFLRKKGLCSVERIGSWRKFFATVWAVRDSCAGSQLVILNYIKSASSKRIAVLFLVWLLLGRKCSHIIGFHNGGLPMPGGSGNSKNTLSAGRKMTLLFTCPQDFFAQLWRFIISKSSALLRYFQINTHVFVAGTDWESSAEKQCLVKRAKMIRGHSNDLSNVYARESDKAFQDHLGEIAVFLEPPAPLFAGDYSFQSSKTAITPEKWFLALTAFFDYIEKSTGRKVVIGGHYKTNHPSPCSYYGNRPVYYGRTRDLVERASLVVTRDSTAISYAVALGKPVVFVVSDELLDDPSRMRVIHCMSAATGSVLVNIDDDAGHWPAMPVIPDTTQYIQYAERCLSSTQEKLPNYELIVRAVKGARRHAGCAMSSSSRFV